VTRGRGIGVARMLATLIGVEVSFLRFGILKRMGSEDGEFSQKFLSSYVEI